MTRIRLLLATPSASGITVPAVGEAVFRPTRKRTVVASPDVTVLPAGFPAPLPSSGPLVVELAPTGPDWVWEVRFAVVGMKRWTEYVAVPDVEELDYEDLVKVNPRTLEPLEEPTALWYAYAAALETTAAGARAAAEIARDAATGSAGSALASATAAADSADEAGTSAFNAGASAASALGHRNAAEAARTGAENARNAADGASTAAADARTAAQAARDAAALSASDAAGSASAAVDHASFAAGHRSAADLARTAAEAARDAAGTFHSTTVDTGYVDGNGHLILRRNDDTLDDAGYVVGPPTQLSVLGTTTGPETPGATGPQGVKGDKGDPGGIVLGTSLGTTDLNTIVTSGVYRQTNSSGADSPLTKNYPYQGGYGVLTVFETTQNATSDVVQEFRSQHYATGIDARGFWRRNRSNNVWSPWRFHASTRTDQTAGRAIYIWDEVNGREQLAYGDTGWRDISGSLLNGWTATWARVRRFGADITLTFLGLNSSVATSDVFFTLPAGLKANTGGYHQGFWFTDTTVSPGFLRLTGGGNLELTRRPATAYSANLQSVVKFTTDDTWPTVLPGTAAGSVQNA
ncbi:hypothetical protein SEA_PRAIRIE_31 [Arthrobacter phage Prairie]|uniref:Minor tail protein n=1 Tax=Arthrobacter phage Prairie TaxID=2816463 RepID=A0A8A5LRU3_9CAUD|nr:hypothetical protein SEA_PRAIRIE_31 [Arthrobacter phage Prairie]